MNTHDLTSRIRAFVASLEAAGGEADDTTEADLLALANLADDKAEALVYTLTRLDLEVQAEADVAPDVAVDVAPPPAPPKPLDLFDQFLRAH